MPTCAVISFRLRGTDGVSVVADSWISILGELGFDVVTVAGDGPVDRLLPDLAIGRWPDGRAGRTGPAAATAAEVDALTEAVREALADAELTVVENLGSIPMNLPAAEAVARALAGRAALWHHHDLPWQRDRYGDVDGLPVDDPAWRHVVINDTTRAELADRGIRSVTIRNGFDPDPPAGDRTGERARHGFADDELVVAHPVRAIRRKDVPAAAALAGVLGGTYWLTGPAEEGYGQELAAILDRARAGGVRVVHEPAGDLDDLYAAADVVAFTSTWEGFGNPPIEAATHRRPAIVSHYPVADELRALGFRWFEPGAPEPLRRWLASPDATLLDHNRAVVAEHLSPASVRAALWALLDEAGWLP